MHVYVRADKTTDERHVGMIDTIKEMLADPDLLPPNTLGDMEVWGTADPLPYEYGYTEEQV